MPASTVVAARSLAGEMRGGPITSASVRSILHAGVAYGRKQHLLANSSRLRCSSLCCLQVLSRPFARWRDAVDKRLCTIHMRQEVTRCDDAPHVESLSVALSPSCNRTQALCHSQFLSGPFAPWRDGQDSVQCRLRANTENHFYMQLSRVCSVGDTLGRHMKPTLTRLSSN